MLQTVVDTQLVEKKKIQFITFNFFITIFNGNVVVVVMVMVMFMDATDVDDFFYRSSNIDVINSYDVLFNDDDDDDKQIRFSLV